MKLTRYLLFIVLVAGLGIGFAYADGADSVQDVKQGTKSIWREVKESARETGAAVKDTAKKVGKGAKKGYRDTKESFKKAVKGKSDKDENKD